MSDKISVNLSSPALVSQIAALSKENLISFQKTLRKILSLSWNQLYQDNGLKWEEITSMPDIILGNKKYRPYSIRLNQKFRAVVMRKENDMVFISLHPDHDSAYRTGNYS